MGKQIKIQMHKSPEDDPIPSVPVESPNPRQDPRKDQEVPIETPPADDPHPDSPPVERS